MSREITRASLSHAPRHEVEEKARETEMWYDRAVNMKDQRDEIAQDLEDALNAMRSYQDAFVTMNMPDPHFNTVKRLCLKYKMSYTDPRKTSMGKVFLDGVDITHDADSTEGSVEEWEYSFVEHLEEIVQEILEGEAEELTDEDVKAIHKELNDRPT